jgi:peptide/nickel transport system permease protein
MSPASPVGVAAARSRPARRGGSWRRPRIVVGLVIVGAWLVDLVAAGWIAPYSPTATVAPRLRSPSAAHWFGTDQLGRDVLARTLYGARESLPVSLVVIAAAVTIGCAVGAAAGYLGGWLDAVLMRVVDMTMAFPPILLAMVVSAGLGPGLWNAATALVAALWPIYARLLRAQVMAIRHREHIEAAVSIGAGRWRILGKHVLPLSMTPVLVSATTDVGGVVLLIASLSFLGLGVPPPTPDWGSMITDGAANFYQWWMGLAPGLAIFSVVIAINILGEDLRDALDPRGGRR